MYLRNHYRICEKKEEDRWVLVKSYQKVDVVLPAKSGVEIRKRSMTRPTPHQAIQLQHLNLQLPSHTKLSEMTKM